jgi:hypothetical protein
LDGAFCGAAEEDSPGSYPLVFDSPDAALHSDLRLPTVVEVQIAAFAHKIAYYDSPDAYAASQEGQRHRFSSQTFIPSTVRTADRTNTDPPDSDAFFNGHVIESGIRANGLTQQSFFWALVETFYGRYDVVIERDLLPLVPAVGGVLSGSFWLSGRIISPPTERRSWLRKLLRSARGREI